MAKPLASESKIICEELGQRIGATVFQDSTPFACMRIAFNGSIIDSFLSGLGVYAANLARALAGMHEDIVVYTSSPDLCGVKAATTRKISELVQPRLGRRGHLQRLVWLQTAFPARLLAAKASVVFSPLPEGMLFPMIPQVVVVHDILPLRFPKEYPRQQYYFRHFVPMILKRSTAIIADSENTKKDVIVSYGFEPDKVSVIPAGYDQSRFQESVEVEVIKSKYGLDRYILYVGNLLPHKNLRRLLQAFALIAAKCLHKLVIVGRKDPRYFPALEYQVSSLSLRDRVIFFDYVPLEHLPAFYKGADALLLPSLYEGFGLTALEAMACGCPVVVSRVASLPEVCGDAAYYIDPYEETSIAEGMYKVLTEEPLRRSLVRNGDKRVKLFSWERTAQETLRVLDNVING